MASGVPEKIESGEMDGAYSAGGGRGRYIWGMWALRIGSMSFSAVRSRVAEYLWKTTLV